MSCCRAATAMAAFTGNVFLYPAPHVKQDFELSCIRFGTRFARAVHDAHRPESQGRYRALGEAARRLAQCSISSLRFGSMRIMDGAGKSRAEANTRQLKVLLDVRGRVEENISGKGGHRGGRSAT